MPASFLIIGYKMLGRGNVASVTGLSASLKTTSALCGQVHAVLMVFGETTPASRAECAFSQFMI